MSDQFPPLPDDVRALLDAAEPPAPSGAFEAKLFAKVSATLGVLPPGGGPSSGGPSSGGPSSGGPSGGGPSSGASASGASASGASASGASASGVPASGASASASASGAASGAVAAGASGAAAGGAASGAVALTKTTLALGGALLLGVGVAGGVALGRTVWSPEPVVVQAPPVVIHAPPAVPPPPKAEPPPRVETAEPPPSAPVRPVVAKPARSTEVTPPKEPTPPATRDTQLSQERALLEVARTALAKGDVTGTLDAVERHARDFPDGRLAEEREVLFIQALVQAGRKDEAARHADAFKKHFPDSLMLPAVDAALAP